LAAWQDHTDLPRWIQRGSARFVNGIGEPWDQVVLEEDFAAFGFTLMYSLDEAYSPPRYARPQLVEQYFSGGGVRQSFYICPTTLYPNKRNAHWRGHDSPWWCDVYAKYPYAEAAAALNPDGAKKTAYAGEWTRNVSSRASDDWAGHLGQIMRWMAQGPGAVTNPHVKGAVPALPTAGHCEAFYLDNPGLIVSYDATSLSKFKAYALEHLGKHEDPRTSQDPAIRIAWSNFQYLTHARFFKQLSEQAHALHPPRYTWTNYTGGPERELSDLGSIDVIYSENTLNAPPLHWNLYDFKRLLALQHGRAVGISYYKFPYWIKLDPTGKQRVLSWKMKPEFVALGIAEGMASDGAHILHPGSYLYHPGWRDLVRTYVLFQRRNEDLFRLAQMTASVGLVLPAASAGRGGPDLYLLARRLSKLGIAFEVILETDLTLEALKALGFRVLLVPHAHCLSTEHVRVLKALAEGGGMVLVSEHFAQRDELGYPQDPKVAASLVGPRAADRFLYNLPLDARLEGFVPGHSGRITLPVGQANEGWARVTFNGREGTYDVGVRYADEWDGVSTMALSVNDAEAERWLLDGEDAITWHHVRNVALKPGDTIGLYGRANMGEWCRTYNIAILPAGESQTPSERQVGAGAVVYSPGPLEGLGDRALRGYLVTRANVSVRADGEADVTVNALRTQDGRALSVHLLNHTYTSRERYTAFASPESVARVHLPRPADIPADKLALRFLSYGDGKFTLHVRCNGTDLEPIEGTKLRGKKWTTLPVGAALIRETNVIEFRVSGQLSYTNNFFALYDSALLELISRDARSPAVPFAVDLTPVNDVEVRIALATVPNDASALLVSPDREPLRLSARQDSGSLVVTVPDLRIYSVLVFSADKAYLARVEERNHPPYFGKPILRTKAWAELAAAGIVGNRVPSGAIEGDLHVHHREGLDTESLAGRSHRSRASWVRNLKRGVDWDLVDGRLVRLPTSRALYEGRPSWWDYTWAGGRQVSERLVLWTLFRKQQLAPPGFSPIFKPGLRIEPCSGRGEDSRGVCVIGPPGSGLLTTATGLEAGRIYEIRAWIQVQRGATLVRATGLAHEFRQSLEPGSWTYVSHRFESDGKPVRLDFALAGDGPGVFLLDDVAMQEIPTTAGETQ